MAYQPLQVIQCKILFLHTYQMYMIWFDWFLWHIDLCPLFKAKSYFYINIRYIWFGLVGLYGISIVAGYLMPNSLSLSIYIYIIWFVLVLWHCNHCWSFNAKSFLLIYIQYIWFCLVGFYGILTIVGYLMPSCFTIYIKYMICKYIL